MKIKNLIILTVFITYSAALNASSSIFYNDTKLINEIKTLDKNIQVLNTKYTKVNNENKTLKSSLSNLKKQNKKLLNNFSVFKKTALKNLKEVKQQQMSKNSDIDKNMQVLLSKNNDIDKNMQVLENGLSDLMQKYEKSLQQFTDYQEKTKNYIAVLGENIDTNSRNIVKTSKVLGTKIESTKKTTHQLGTRVDDTHEVINKNMYYWVVAFVVIALFILALFIFFRRGISTQKNDLNNTKKQLEEEGIRLDNKLIDVLESQLKIVENNANKETNKEADHTLALKVADEIIRIQKNLTRMDASTKGLKQLKASVTRIQDNFASNGYELVEMLGMPYNEGMKVTANFIPDDDLEEGEQIITRIIKPQVNYNGVMIQSAQIEVSQA